MVGGNLSGGSGGSGQTYGSTASDESPPSKAVGDHQTNSCSCCCRGGCICPCRHLRYRVAVLCCLGLAISFGFRCNVSAATSYFRDLYNATATSKGNEPQLTHQWSATIIGAVESAYFVGYMAIQIPGGIIANKYPPTALFSAVILASSALHLFLPLAFSTSFILAIIIRLLQGLLEGFSHPAFHGIWRYWAPPQDRSRLVTLAISGSYIGACLGLMLSGVLAERLGWRVSFYVYGAAGILWFCVWHFCVYQKPSSHPCITDEEQMYIEASIGENMDVQDRLCDLPWGRIFTSMPVYAIIVANFARNWSLNLLTLQVTKYFDDVFNYPTAMSGYFSALPHLIMAFIVPIGGQVADILRNRWLTTTIVRKLFNCTGLGVEAVFLLALCFVRDANVATVCFAVAASFSGLAISGFNVNHLDIAPRYSSILMGLSNSFGSVAGALMPAVTLQMVQDHRRESWTKVFLIASLLHFAGVIFYAIFASGERQDWAEAPEGSEDRWKLPTFKLAAESPKSDDSKCDKGVVADNEELSPESISASTVPSLLQTGDH